MVKKGSEVLTVLMNGRVVGKLEKMYSGGLIFYYDPTWLQSPDARPISLSLPLVPQPFVGDLVYNFFDNLLPDNPIIKARIQAKFKAATSKPFDLLASIGRDCVGAIQLLAGEIIHPILPEKMSLRPVTEKEISAVLRNIQTNPLGMSRSNDEFRISIAGAQEKTAFLFWDGKWNRPFDTTPTSHIFKLPIGFIPVQQMDLSDSCENEWLCTKIAETFGLPVASCEIQYFDKIKALVVERFDRKLSKDGSWLMRLPQEDICQALGISPNLKYEADGGPGIADVMYCLLGSSNPIQDRNTFFKSQILFWLLAAIDGHAKNFSLHIESGGRYCLAPLYDIMSAHPLIAKKQLQEKKIKMAMALKGKNTHYHWYRMQRRHFLDTAQRTHYSTEQAESILNEMLSQVENVIEEVRTKLPTDFPSNIAHPIFNGMILAKRRLLQ